MKKILITYFEPFGGEERNSSAQVGELLPAAIGGNRIEKLLLPVEFSRAAQIAAEKAEEIGADAVIALGQAGARKVITPEMAAINLRFASIPDNAGEKPQDEPVISGAPNAYFATLPVREMARLINENGAPSALSYSAGVYVCNDLYFCLLHHFRESSVGVAFIHLPKEKENLDAGAMAKAMEKMIEIVF